MSKEPIMALALTIFAVILAVLVALVERRNQ
jgi:hypothetical protein